MLYNHLRRERSFRYPSFPYDNYYNDKQGRRLFDHMSAEQIELERTRVLEGENGVIHMHYRVVR